MFDISNDDVLLYHVYQSMNVNVHRMIYDGQQLLNPALLCRLQLFSILNQGCEHGMLLHPFLSCLRLTL
jgi:hypothetical protein